MLKPAEQLMVRIQVKQLTTTPKPLPPHFKVIKTPTNKLSLVLPDYLVYRCGGVLSIINRATGKRERASTLGPKYSILKRLFFEGRMLWATATTLVCLNTQLRIKLRMRHMV